MAAGTRHAGKFGESVESEIHFSRGAAIFVTADFFEEFAGKIARLDELQESEIGIYAGRNGGGVNFFAIFKDHTVGSSVLQQDFRNWSLEADFYARLARCIADGI